MFDVVVKSVAVPDALKRGRAADGTSSARRACENPNLQFMFEARKEPNASAVSSGTVIMTAPALSEARSWTRVLTLARPSTAARSLQVRHHVEAPCDLGSLMPRPQRRTNRVEDQAALIRDRRRPGQAGSRREPPAPSTLLHCAASHRPQHGERHDRRNNVEGRQELKNDPKRCGSVDISTAAPTRRLRGYWPRSGRGARPRGLRRSL